MFAAMELEAPSPSACIAVPEGHWGHRGGCRTRICAVVMWQDSGIGNVTWLSSRGRALKTTPTVGFLAAADEPPGRER